MQLLVNHGGLPLAGTASGTMALSEDERGLKVDADLDDEDPDVQSLARKMARGDIDQMSFAFRATNDRWNAECTQRTIAECDIHRGDVSVVNQGANPATSTALSARSLAGGRQPTTLAERRQLAEVISRGPVVVETRSVTLGGVGYELLGAAAAADPDACNRCGGGGTISPQGLAITCPQCKGTGGPEGNASPESDDGLARNLRRLHRLQLIR